MGHHIFSCRSLLLSTIVLNDIYIYIEYLIVGIDKECMECNFFTRLDTHLTIGFSWKN